MNELNEPDSTKHIVRGLRRNGDEVFYTGRAGTGFVSPDVRDAFVYISHPSARNRATTLNHTEPIHGIWFIAMQADRLKERIAQ